MLLTKSRKQLSSTYTYDVWNKTFEINRSNWEKDEKQTKHAQNVQRGWTWKRMKNSNLQTI